MCLDFYHAEAGAVFVAETAFVAGLDQRDTPRNMEWTHHATNLDSLVVCKAGDTSLSSVDIVIIKGERQCVVMGYATVDCFMFANQVLTDEVREFWIVG